MKKTLFLAAVLAVGAGVWARSGNAGEEAHVKTPAELEKEKALANPFANDLGPGQIDEIVKSYPAQYQEGYKLLKVRCAQCHQPNRPLNSQFIETEGASEAERKAKVASIKKAHPEWFKDRSVMQIEWDVWQRYVKRMMSKPGCNIESKEGKKIWQFLVYDSSHRKLKDPEAWIKHRKSLVEQFKTKYPKRFDELYGPGGSEAGPMGN